MIMSILYRTEPTIDNSFSNEKLDYGQILKSVEGDYLQVNIRGRESRAEIIEIILSKPLKAASAKVLLKADNRIQPLGQITSLNTYHFSIPKNAVKLEQIQLYDYLKDREISIIDL